MLVYYIILISAVGLGALLCREKFRFGKAIYCVIMFAVLFGVSAVRKSTGHDYNSYATEFYSYNFKTMDAILKSRLEKGFAVPMKILSTDYTDYQVMFVIVALVVAMSVMIYIYKNSSVPWISVVAFMTFGLYFNSMNFLRQIICAIIVTYALRYIKTKQLLRYIVLVLFAMCFHLSAIVMLPFFFILQIKITKLTLSAYTAISIGIYLSSNKILTLVTKYIYEIYDPQTSREMTNGIPISYFVFFLAFFVVAFALRKRLYEKNSFNEVLLSSFFFGVFFVLIGTKHGIISRLMLPFMIAPVLALIPDLVISVVELVKEKIAVRENSKISERLAVVLTCAVLAFGSLAMLQNFLCRNYNGVVPYKTIYEQESSEGGGVE